MLLSTYRLPLETDGGFSARIAADLTHSDVGGRPVSPEAFARVSQNRTMRFGFALDASDTPAINELTARGWTAR